MATVDHRINAINIDHAVRGILPDVRVRAIPPAFRKKVEAWWHLCGLKRLTVAGTDHFVPQTVVEMAGQRLFGQATKRNTYARTGDAATLTHEKTHHESHKDVATYVPFMRDIEEAISFATEVAMFGNWDDVCEILAGNSYPRAVEELTTLLLRIYYIHGNGDFVEAAVVLGKTLAGEVVEKSNSAVDHLLKYPTTLVPLHAKQVASKTLIDRKSHADVVTVRHDQQTMSFSPQLTDEEITIRVYFQICFGVPAAGADHICRQQQYTSLEEAIADESPIKRNVINAYRRLASMMYLQTNTELTAVRTHVATILELDMAEHALAAWKDMESTVAVITELFGTEVVAEIMGVAVHSTLIARQIAQHLPALGRTMGHDRTLATRFVQRFAQDVHFRNFCLTGGFADINELLERCYGHDQFYARKHLEALFTFPLGSTFAKERQGRKSSSVFSVDNPCGNNSIPSQILRSVPVEYHQQAILLIPRINNLLWFIQTCGVALFDCLAASTWPEITELQKTQAIVRKSSYVYTNNEEFWIWLLQSTEEKTTAISPTAEVPAKAFYEQLERKVVEIEAAVKGYLGRSK